MSTGGGPKSTVATGPHLQEESLAESRRNCSLDLDGREDLCGVRVHHDSCAHTWLSSPVVGGTTVGCSPTCCSIPLRSWR